MKFSKKLLAAAVSSVVASPAFAAVSVADLQNAANVVIWHGGASASTASVQEAVVNAVCDTTATVSVFGNNAAIASADFWTVDCTAKSGISGVTAGQRVLYNKRDRDGSSVGVTPLITGTSVGFLAPLTDDGNGANGVENCPAAPTANPTVGTTVVDYYNCTGFTRTTTSIRNTLAALTQDSDSVLIVPTIGTSDIEPDKFLAPLNQPAAVDLDNNGSSAGETTGTQNNTLTANGAGFLVFGVVANLPMWQDLQRAQFPSGHPLYNDCNPAGSNYALVSGTPSNPNNKLDNANLAKCMPELKSTEIRSIFSSTGSIRNSTDFQIENGYQSGTFVALESTGTTGGVDTIQICRRVNGSGTQAQFNANLLGYPCDAAGQTLQPAARSALNTFVHNNSGSGDVENCLETYATGTDQTTVANSTTGIGYDGNTLVRWAIGIQSVERNASLGKRYRFLKIDGGQPTLADVHAGDYLDYAQQHIQAVNPTGALAGVFAAMTAALSTPASLGTLGQDHAFGRSGWLAVPTSTNPPTSEVSSTLPISPFLKVSSTGTSNTCALPSAFNRTGAETITVAPQGCSVDNNSADQNCYNP
jgi:hypothetical protein